MSLPTVAAARIYKNQQKHQNENLDDLADFDGNSEKLSWEEFPNVGLSMVSSSYIENFLMNSFEVTDDIFTFF